MPRTANKTALATCAALIGFALNSLLCRAALGSQAIDAWTFTFLRLGSGAVTLFVLVRIAASNAASGTSANAAPTANVPATSVPSKFSGSWGSALALFTYAAAFSLAYLRLNTGVGALVLFTCVQATMIGWSIKCGERPTWVEWLGIAVALGGLVFLTLPGAVAPDPVGIALMMIAGIAWGAYSLRGRASREPLLATAGNFRRSVPMALLGAVLAASAAHATLRGMWLALASGSIASGLGYSLWYKALPGLAATRAAVVQLVVPILAATLGVVVLGEQLNPRLVLSATMILGGIGVAVLGRRAKTATTPTVSTDVGTRSLVPNSSTVASVSSGPNIETNVR